MESYSVYSFCGRMSIGFSFLLVVAAGSVLSL